jgi:hypothetical protein
MPEKTHIQFENIQKQLEFPVIIVADFESVLSPIPPPPPKPSNTTTKKAKLQDEPKTVIVNEHQPCGYAYKVISNILPHLTKYVRVRRFWRWRWYWRKD